MTKVKQASPVLNLGADFPIATPDDWRAAAERLLKGKPFETLRTATYEEITLEPIYHTAGSARPAFFQARAGAEWQIAQSIRLPDPAEFNRAVREALQMGQTAVKLALDGAGLQGMDDTQLIKAEGTAISTADDLRAALSGIDLQQVPLAIEAGVGAPAVAAFLFRFCAENKIAPEQLHGCIAGDPLAELARSGALPGTESTLLGWVAKLAAWANTHLPGMRTLGVDATPYQNAGGNAAQELGCAMATAASYLRACLAPGTNLSVAEAAARFRFSFAIGGNFFIEIAKLRAARILWRNLARAFDESTTTPMFLHAETSRWNKTSLDPHVNLLRATTEAMAAVAGGCDSLDVRPFDEVGQPANDFSQRLARNIQLILKNESHLDRVADTGGGAWHIETLTEELAQKAWQFFQQIEAAGGMLAALKQGLPQKEIAFTAAKKEKNIAAGKDRYVGANAFSAPKPGRADAPHSDLAFYQQRSALLRRYKLQRKTETVTAALEQVRNANRERNPEGFSAVLAAAESGATLEEICAAMYGTGEEMLEVEPLALTRGLETLEPDKQSGADRPGETP